MNMIDTPDTTTLDTLREKFAATGCGSREEFDVVVEAIRFVLAEKPVKPAPATVVKHAVKAKTAPKTKKRR